MCFLLCVRALVPPSIGIELVNSPSLLILDEPTTGLDATSSQGLLHTLKSISRRNTTVVAVLHQPRNEIFRGLDDLLLLAPGGRTVYFGPAAKTQQYFESIGYACDGNTNPVRKGRNKVKGSDSERERFR